MLHIRHLNCYITSCYYTTVLNFGRFTKYFVHSLYFDRWQTSRINETQIFNIISIGKIAHSSSKYFRPSERPYFISENSRLSITREHSVSNCGVEDIAYVSDPLKNGICIDTTCLKPLIGFEFNKVFPPSILSSTHWTGLEGKGTWKE